MKIQIRKRDGRLEELCAVKTKKMVEFACRGLAGCDPIELELDAKIQFRDGMSTREIQKTLIQTAIEKVIAVEEDAYGNQVKKTHTNWQYVAARLLAYDLYKEAAIYRGYNHFGYGSYEALFEKLIEMGLYGAYLKENYTMEEVRELAAYIKPERDELFNYEGIKLLNDRYLVKGFNKEVLELPQERFLTIAMHLAIPEGRKKVHYAKAFYDLLSQLKMTVATPTLANAGTAFYQLSSCFISTVGDNLWSIYDVNHKFLSMVVH